MKIFVDLADMDAGDWGQTVQEIILDELRACLRRRVQQMLREDPQLKVYLENLKAQFTRELLEGGAR